MIIKLEDIIKLMMEAIEDDKVIVDNYSKVNSIIDKINKEQSEQIFEQLVHNHEISSEWARKFQAKSNLFAKQAKKGGMNPLEIAKLESLQEESEALGQKRIELELAIGKNFLDRGFISKETYDKYYPE